MYIYIFKNVFYSCMHLFSIKDILKPKQMYFSSLFGLIFQMVQAAVFYPCQTKILRHSSISLILRHNFN